VDPRVREESGAKIKDEVDASKLLEGLEEDTGDDTETEAVIRGSEAVKVGT
jgi:hypothetical protein